MGNIGREQGSLKWPLLAAYAAYPIRFYVYDEAVWFTLMVLASSLAFDTFSKEWRRTRTKRNIVKSVLLSLLLNSDVFSGNVTISKYLLFNQASLRSMKRDV